METIPDKTMIEEEFGIMEYQVYIIKDDLPASIVRDLPKLIDEIPGIKYFVDFKAFVMIEFSTKAAADAAKKEGFKYKLNGEDYSKTYSTSSRVSCYVQDKFKTNVGVGY